MVKNKKEPDDSVSDRNRSKISEVLVEYSPYGLILIEASGRWLFVNPAFTQITGYTLEDIPDGRAWFNRAFPDEKKRKEVSQLWKKDYQEGITKDREFEIVCKDGQKKWLEMRSSFRPDGTVVVTLHDISERKSLEQAKKESETYYRALLEAIPDMVVITDPEGYITYASEITARFLGYESAQELVGKNNQDFFAPEDLGKIQQIGPLITTQGFLSPIIAGIIKKNREKRVVEISSSVVRISGQQPAAYIGIMRDITERINLEANLRQMLREKEVLIREIHHRVKNNLQLIHSLLRLQVYHNASPEVKTALKDTLSRVRAIALIYESLLRSERLDQINLKTYLDKIVSHLVSLYHKKGKNIQVLLNLEEVSVDLSAAHPCGLIVSELVSNSLKYAFADRSEGTIRITLHKSDEQKITLVVSDDGVGLPADFDFKKATSFGWQIVHDLVRQLNATLTWKSDGGTEVAVTFRV